MSAHKWFNFNKSILHFWESVEFFHTKILIFPKNVP